jgi:type VI protein secretion system component VasF
MPNDTTPEPLRESWTPPQKRSFRSMLTLAIVFLAVVALTAATMAFLTTGSVGG